MSLDDKAKIKLVAECLLWLPGFVQQDQGRLLKRVDEKHVTEKAYDNPRFVEDLSREVTLRLKRDPRVRWFAVEVENFESIHAHNAYASIEQWNGSEAG